MNAKHGATTWRDLADQLTPEQIVSLADSEQGALGDPVEAAELNLWMARDRACKNLDDARFGHLPMPAGASKVFHWGDDDGHWSRDFTGTERRVVSSCREKAGVDIAEKVDVDIAGVQYDDGRTERHVYVYISADAAKLTAADAREHGKSLLEAADEMQRWIV